MKLPYSLIFRDGGSGEDGDEIACGLSAAYMRFLFAVQDFPHTFYSDSGERVLINDDERQLLEQGVAGLSSFFVNEGCAMLVASRGAGLDQIITGAGSVEVPLAFESGFQDTDYILFSPYPGGATFIRGGLYRVKTRVRHLALTGTPFRALLRTRINGAHLVVADDTIESAGKTMETNQDVIVNSGDTLTFFYAKFTGEDVPIQNVGNSLQVVRLG